MRESLVFESGGLQTNTYYKPDVIQYSDYYPFGMQMPGRTYTPSDSYKYGFNGKEMDNEVHNLKGTSYDFGARMYDPRVARFLSRDRFSYSFASISTYEFAGNSPILYIDMNGDFKIVITDEAKKEKGAEIKVKRFEAILRDLPNYLNENPRVVNEIIKQTGLSKEQIMKDATYGDGVTITIGINMLGASAPTSNNILIDYTLIESLENFKSSDKLDNAALDLIFAALILHEYTHVGDRKKNNEEITGTKEGDVGKQDANGVIKPSKYNHRGLDVEATVTGTTTSTSGDVEGELGNDGDFYRTGADFHVDNEDLNRVKARVSVIKGVPGKKNVLPMSQTNP